VKLTTHLQLELRPRKRGFIHPFPHTSSWRIDSLVKYRDNFTFIPYLGFLPVYDKLMLRKLLKVSFKFPVMCELYLTDTSQTPTNFNTGLSYY
jgi:hypothetical protein